MLKTRGGTGANPKNDGGKGKGQQQGNAGAKNGAVLYHQQHRPAKRAQRKAEVRAEQPEQDVCQTGGGPGQAKSHGSRHHQTPDEEMPGRSRAKEITVPTKQGKGVGHLGQHVRGEPARDSQETERDIEAVRTL